MARRFTLLAAWLLLAPGFAAAQEIKVGVALPFTGIGAEYGQQIHRAMELYLKINADRLKPYKIELIKRDTKGPTGATAKVVVQELITQDKVDVIAGFSYSPDAFASAPVVTAGRKLAVILNAGTAHVTATSPNFIRVSFSMWHASFAMGEATAKNLKAKTAVIGYVDQPAGRDSRDAFKRAFEANGGKVIDEIPMGTPSSVPDFTPFFQRVKSAKPDVFFIFVGSGAFCIAAVKTYAALGLNEAGIRLIATGDTTQDTMLQQLGPAAVGLLTMHHYHADLDNPENRAFVAAWKKEYGDESTPDFMAVAGYDGMAAIAHVVLALEGKLDDVDRALAALKGWRFASPRGPIMIDPATRDIVMNEYLSEVVMANGRLRQKTIAQFDAIKDPCKTLKIGPCATP